MGDEATPPSTPNGPDRRRYLTSRNSSMPIMGPFAPKTGLLHAAERCRLSGDQTRVDADHSAFELIGNAPNPSDIAAKKVTGETEFGIIRKLNRFLIFVKPEERSNGSECFLPSNFHLGRHIRKDGRFKKCVAQTVSFAPKQHARAFGDSI